MTKEYHEGVLAFEHATPNSENPYPSRRSIDGNAKRVYWFSGWYDAMFAGKYPQYFTVER